MTTPDHPIDEPRRVGRRQLLRTGGLTVSLAALLAACGKSGGGITEPGRVGYAPVPTDLATEVVDDGVRLRTAQSIEYLIIDMYARIAATGELPAEDQELLDALTANHERTADELGDLIVGVGAEPYECANAWYEDRVVPAIEERLSGDPELDIEPSDDPVRDMLAVMNAMESMATQMYQAMVEVLSTPELRAESITLGARSARHAAVVAIHATGAPEGYVNPVLYGGTAPDPADGVVPIFAIPTEFGSLQQLSLVIGAASSAGTRATIAIETPADNSYVYTGQVCQATD
jgi:hypothetical protein